MRGIKSLAVIAGGISLGAMSLNTAHAAVISTYVNAGLGSSPLTISVGGGAGTLSFTAAVTGYGPGAAVATGGTVMIAGTGFGLGDYENGTVFDGTASFAAYPSAATIPFSAVDDFIGFSYLGTDGTHLGFAEVDGSSLVGYAYESLANTSITATNVVPEPASIAIVLGGLAGLGLTRRRKRAPIQG